MGVVDEKRDRPAAEGGGGICDPAYICRCAEVVGAGDIDREGETAPGCHLFQGGAHLFRRRMTGADRFQIRAAGIDPFHVAVQHGAGIQKGFVHVSRRQDNGPARRRILFPAAEQGKIEHGADRETGPFCGVKSHSCAEERGSISFAFPDDAGAFAEYVSALDLRDVTVLDTQRAVPLVPGHVQPGGAGGDVVRHKIIDRCRHVPVPFRKGYLPQSAVP